MLADFYKNHLGRQILCQLIRKTASKLLGFTFHKSRFGGCFAKRFLSIRRPYRKL